MNKIKYTERFNKLWSIYDNDLCHGKKGSKFTALQAFNKYTDEEQDRIIFDTQALIRHFKSQKKPDRLPHVSTWINQRYFDQELPSQIEKVVVELGKCKICSNPVHGSKFDLCQDCIHQFHADRWKETRKQILIDLGLHQPGLSLSELAIRCREYLVKGKSYSSMLNSLKSPES